MRPLLGDPDQGVRETVIWVLRRSGSACGRFADEVAAIAMRYSQTAGQVAFTAEYHTMKTLMLLGDPRWAGPFCAAAAGHAARARRLLAHGVRCNPQALEEARRQLAQLRGSGGEHPAIPLLATVLGHWGSGAAAAIPELLEVLPHAGEAVAVALLRTGHRAPEMVPFLRALAEHAGDVEAAKGVWHLTGDPRPLTGTLHVLLTGDRAQVPAAHSVTEVGSGLLPLVSAAQACLTGTAARTYPQRDAQVLAARVVSAASGDPAPALPTMRAVLADRGTPASRAADLAADLAATQPAAVSQLAPILRDLLDDPWSRVAASGNDDDLVWQDEILQDQLRATIAALRAAWQP